MIRRIGRCLLSNLLCCRVFSACPLSCVARQFGQVDYLPFRAFVSRSVSFFLSGTPYCTYVLFHHAAAESRPLPKPGVAKTADRLPVCFRFPLKALILGSSSCRPLLTNDQPVEPHIMCSLPDTHPKIHRCALPIQSHEHPKSIAYHPCCSPCCPMYLISLPLLPSSSVRLPQFPLDVSATPSRRRLDAGTRSYLTVAPRPRL